MPIRWYGPANPEDPTYRHFERVVNLTLHAAAFAAVNSGLWFLQGIRHPFTHLAWLSEGWGLLLAVQVLSVLLRRPKTDASESS